MTQPKKPLFYHIYADYGMTSDKTTVIYQDYKGYVWIGTEEGLNRFISYNDYLFKTYKSERTDSTSLDNDYITALYEDSQKRLWVGSLSGLCLYNRALDNFVRVCHRHPEMMNKPVNSITEHNGQLWIGNSDQLIVYDPDSDLIVKTFELNNIANEKQSINDLLPSKNHIWVGASSGLYLIEDMRLDEVKGFEGQDISSLALSHKNTLLVGTKNSGLAELNKSGKITTLTTSSKPRITSNQINDLLPLEDGSVWIATNAGLTFLNMEKWSTHSLQYDFNNFYGLTDHEVRSLFKDNIGAIWMTTPLGGVNYYHDSDNQFDYFGQQTSTGKDDELLDYNVLSLHRDQSDSDKLWVGTRSGLSLFSERENKFKHFPFTSNNERQNNQILSIAEDPKGTIWLGTERGLYVWDRQAKHYTAKQDYLELSNRVNVVYPDNLGNIWIGTRDKGLKRISAKSQMNIDIGFIVAEDKINIPNINDIMQHPDGTIWVGTASGLYYVEQDQLVTRPLRIGDAELSNSWVNYLCKSSSGKLLVGTRQEGLIMLNYKGKDEVLLNKEIGIPSNDIRSMIRVNNELTWVSTNAGLSKIKMNGEEVLEITNFYVHDGLQGKQFTPRAGVSLRENVYFGGLSGITSFSPTNIHEYSLKMLVNLEKLKINDTEVTPNDNYNVLTKSIVVTDTIILEPDQNNITLEFTAMDFARPDSIKFKYRLLNYDEGWLFTDKAMVIYTNLPRGKQFTFEVMAKSRFRDWSDPRQLTIYVEPYFYETAWFQILVAFVLVAILFALMRFRELSAEIKQKSLQKMVDEKTRELNEEVKVKEHTAKQLEKAKNDAEKANRVKSEFLANISHEIRTPLNGILGMSHLVSENEPNVENREMLNILSRSAESLRDIIDDLLDLSKIEAGKFDIVNEEFNLPQLISEVTQAFHPEIAMKSLELNVEVYDDIPSSLKGDELRIKQVLVNLLSNSVKFTEQGTIGVTAKKLNETSEDAKILIQVMDTGIGIPTDKTEEIFSSFTQIDTGSKRKYAGTGLGLAICKKLVGLMDGKIWVESRKENGSIFNIELTLKLGYIADDVNTISKIEIPEGRKILLVEDNMVNTMVAVKMLEKSNQRVDTAIHGREALKKLRENHYDLILMDVQMPVMDGLETTSEIRKSNFKSANTPIVALTAGAMIKDRDRCLEVGMNDFIAKPIMYDQLARILTRYLSNPEEVPSMPK
ncbi:MAG: two-component regulator propeller domain-containing protein [Marinoscillum sp.]